MRKLSLILAALVAVLVVSALPAFADEVKLTGTDQNIYFCSTGPDQPIDVSASSICSPTGATYSSTTPPTASPTGEFYSPFGTRVLLNEPWTMVFPSAFSFTKSNPSLTNFDVFTNGGGTSFSFGTGGDTLSGTINWTLVKDDTIVPNLVGTLLIGAPGGTGLLAPGYPQGSSVYVTLTLDTTMTLNSLWATASGTNTSAIFSVGEIPTMVPEPGTVLLMGAGLLVVGSFLRRRGRAQVG